MLMGLEECAGIAIPSLRLVSLATQVYLGYGSWTGTERMENTIRPS